MNTINVCIWLFLLRQVEHERKYTISSILLLLPCNFYSSCHVYYLILPGLPVYKSSNLYHSQATYLCTRCDNHPSDTQFGSKYSYLYVLLHCNQEIKKEHIFFPRISSFRFFFDLLSFHVYILHCVRFCAIIRKSFFA